MKPKLSHLRIGVIGVMAITANLAHAQTTGPGTYYAIPSWDQKLQCDTQATCPRFVVLSNWNNAAVLDRETGLVWEKSRTDSDSFDWFRAQTHCASLMTGGRLGWRLPTVQELASLVDPSVPFQGTALPPGHPFTGNRLQNDHWSATASGSINSFNQAWAVSFFAGSILGNLGPDTKNITKFAWCVNGGSGGDVQ
jgi:hypothetical protein